jgi:hypothetical protein
MPLFIYNAQGQSLQRQLLRFFCIVVDIVDGYTAFSIQKSRQFVGFLKFHCSFMLLTALSQFYILFPFPLLLATYGIF